MPGPGASRDAPGSAVSSVHARVEQDLGVAVLALVETGIGVRCLGQRDVLGHHEAGLGAAFDDHVAQLVGIALGVGLTGPHRLALLEEARSEEHTSELQSRGHLVCRLLLEKKKYPASAQRLI